MSKCLVFNIKKSTPSILIFEDLTLNKYKRFPLHFEFIHIDQVESITPCTIKVMLSSILENLPTWGSFLFFSTCLLENYLMPNISHKYENFFHFDQEDIFDKRMSFNKRHESPRSQILEMLVIENLSKLACNWEKADNGLVLLISIEKKHVKTTWYLCKN